MDDVVVALDEALRPAASGLAQGLRRKGRTVELVMEAKKMKWAFKVGPGVVCLVFLGSLGLLEPMLS